MLRLHRQGTLRPAAAPTVQGAVLFAPIDRLAKLTGMPGVMKRPSLLSWAVLQSTGLVRHVFRLLAKARDEQRPVPWVLLENVSSRLGLSEQFGADCQHTCWAHVTGIKGDPLWIIGQTHAERPQPLLASTPPPFWWGPKRNGSSEQSYW
jgi:hypothetical protein